MFKSSMYFLCCAVNTTSHSFLELTPSNPLGLSFNHDIISLNIALHWYVAFNKTKDR